MAIPMDDGINQVMKIPAVKKLQATVDHSLWNGLMVGAVTAVSGLLDGPRGVAIGGALSSVVAGYYCQGKFESAVTIIKNLNDKEKQELWDEIYEYCRSLGIYNMPLFIKKCREEGFVNSIINILSDFFKENLNMKIC